MLPKSHQQEYQDFLTLLEPIQSTCTTLLSKTERHQEYRAIQGDILLLQQQFQDLQPWFEGHILTLTETEIEPNFISRWRSLQTEIKRAFRLLTTNMLLLKSSRQTKTVATRVKTVQDNLDKLTDYCQLLCC
ncbi:MAG: hypothetical protein Tsb0014_42580 [Pleurocapsa sp.]